MQEENIMPTRVADNGGAVVARVGLADRRVLQARCCLLLTNVVVGRNAAARGVAGWWGVQ